MSEKLYDAYEMAKNTSLDEAYNYCLKLEYDRERKHRDTHIGQIEASTLSLDQLVESFEDPSKIQIFSRVEVEKCRSRRIFLTKRRDAPAPQVSDCLSLLHFYTSTRLKTIRRHFRVLRDVTRVSSRIA